jgi:arabinofuranosyltransferase
VTVAASLKVRILLILIPLGVLVVHASYYYPFLADDALISLRYAERLVAGQGLTWNDGEFVEGYTNLLWVLAAALLGSLGLDLILASRLLGLVSALALLFALHRFTLGYRAEAFLLPGLLLALSAPTAVWIIGGLETVMLCAFVALAAAGLAPAVGRSEPGRLPPGLLFPAVMLALAVLTRADAPVLVAGFAVGTLLALRGNLVDRMKAFALVSGIPFAAFLLQLGFRLTYYNSLLPNTFYAKFAVTDHRLQEGVIYFTKFGWTVLPSLAALGLVLLLALWQPRPEHDRREDGSADLLRRLALLLPVAAAWTAYFRPTVRPCPSW